MGAPVPSPTGRVGTQQPASEIRPQIATHPYAIVPAGPDHPILKGCGMESETKHDDKFWPHRLFASSRKP